MKSISFIGGFALGLLCISLVQAALPKRVTPETQSVQPAQVVTELKAEKVTAPDLEQDFDRLQRAEGQYAEDWEQQQRIRTATGAAPAPTRLARPAARPAARPMRAETTTIRTEAASAEAAPAEEAKPSKKVKPQTQLPRDKKRPSR